MIYFNNKLFRILIENPFKTYWKARKYFIRPKIRFQCVLGPQHNYTGRLLELNIQDISWKDKYNSPRHEIDPRINIVLFNYIEFYISFTHNDNIIYWETILDYLYYEHNLYHACENNIWDNLIGKHILPLDICLNKKGKLKYVEILISQNK